MTPVPANDVASVVGNQETELVFAASEVGAVDEDLLVDAVRVYPVGGLDVPELFEMPGQCGAMSTVAGGEVLKGQR